MLTHIAIDPLTDCLYFLYDDGTKRKMRRGDKELSYTNVNLLYVLETPVGLNLLWSR